MPLTCTYQKSIFGRSRHNGGLGGSDVRIIHKTECIVDIKGIYEHQLKDTIIATTGVVLNTQRDHVSINMHQYAYIDQGKTVHLSGQMESFNYNVNYKPLTMQGGLQHVNQYDGFSTFLT